MFFADLSAAADAPGVAGAVAAALRLPPEPAPPRPGQLAARLQGRRLLLVLDTGEHVIDACAALAEGILRAGDGPGRQVRGAAGD
jgi:predicted ATPase